MRSSALGRHCRLSNTTSVSPHAYELLELTPSRLHPLILVHLPPLKPTVVHLATLLLCKLCLQVSHLPIFDLLPILHFARQMLPLIYLRKLISQLPYLLLDGYMKLSNHLIFRAHRISNVLLTSFCYYCCTFCIVFTKQLCSWWGLVEKSWGILRSYPEQLPFYSDFNQVLD